MTNKPYFSDEYYRRSAAALDTALKTAPAYRSWQNFDPADGAHIDERYNAMPELTKEEIRHNFPAGLIPDYRDHTEGLEKNEIEYVQTSGTTAEKVTNIWNQTWWNASEAASWKLNSNTSGLNHSVREAQLTSALSVGLHSDHDLPMESRILNDRFLFLNEKVSPVEWTDFHYKRMVHELNEFTPDILEVNPSFLVRLAWWSIDNDIMIYQPHVILFTYEFVSAMHLNAIRRVFHVPLISSFGSTETGYVFMECEHGTYHQNTEFCRIDFEKLKNFPDNRNVGRILVTTFNNPWASIIRFDTGDLVRLKDDFLCSCGRNEGYMLSDIEGRTANATFTSSGRLVTTRETDNVLSSIEGIRDYHLEQNINNNFMLKLVIKGNKNSIVNNADEAMHSLYGKDISTLILVQDDIETASSGKYRRTLANFDFNIKDYF